MAVNNPSVDFRIPHESLPVPCDQDIDPVPIINSESLSFVVIKSAADLDFDDSSDDSDIADKSLIKDHKQILQDELSQLENHSNTPQPLSQQDKFIDTINQSQNEPKTTDTSQSVFSALPQPEIEPQHETDKNDYDRAISIVSFAPNEFVSEEIQTKVDQLVQENIRLKDTILQNNLSMRAQYENVMTYKQAVTRVHEEHKQKFGEAKKIIETLKLENAALKLDNDNLTKTITQQQTEHNKTKKLLTEQSEHNLKEFELDVANNKVKELEESLEKLTLKSADDLARWQALEEKLVRYENELENAYRKIREYEKYASDRSEASERLLASEQANERAQREIQSLRSQLANTLKPTEETATIRDITTERDRLLLELESKNATIAVTQSRRVKLEEDFKQVNDMLRQHEETIKELREKEEHARIDAWRSRQKVAEVEEKLQRSQLNVEQYKPPYVPELPGELTYLRNQLMESQKALTDMQQGKAIADATIQSLRNEITQLRSQMETQKTQSDDDFALKAQLDIYKADFEAERQAKEEVKREINKLSEDLQLLHRRNQQLQEEIEILIEQLPQSHIRESIQRSHNASAPPPPGRGGYIYKCPKCNFGFNTLNAVENHVTRCIELDDELP